MKPKCSVDNCTNNCMSAGNGYYKKLCSTHHKKKYGMKRTWMINRLCNKPCSICGWKEASCDTHRVINGKDGGKYVKNNIISLCPNCHRVEHRKNKISNFKSTSQTPYKGKYVR